MDNFLAGQIVALGDLGISSLTPVESAAFTEEVGAGSSVNGAVNPTTTKESLVGSIDNTVNLKFSDVAAGEGDRVVENPGTGRYPQQKCEGPRLRLCKAEILC